MKNTLKLALPTIVALVLGYLIIEGIKLGKAKYDAKQVAKKLLDQQRMVAAAQAQADSAEDHEE